MLKVHCRVCEEAQQAAGEAKQTTRRELGMSGGGGCRDSAGNFGIGSRDIDSADGGWDDRMGDSHKSDAEQSEAGGGGDAFANSSATDADAADVHPIMRRRCRRSLRQANLRRLWRPGRRMRPGPRPQPWMLRRIMRVLPGGRCASAGRNCKAGAGVERSGGGSRAHAMAAAADACIWASGQAATGSGGCGGLAGSPAPRSVDECGRSFAVVAAARWQVGVRA